jgi:hypothetical protein
MACEQRTWSAVDARIRASAWCYCAHRPWEPLFRSVERFCATGYESTHACLRLLQHTFTIFTVPCKFLCACGLTGQECLRWHASRGHGRRLMHEPVPVHGATVLTGLGSHSCGRYRGFVLQVTRPHMHVCVYYNTHLLYLPFLVSSSVHVA